MTRTVLSSGFIVFRRPDGEPLFLLLRNAPHGHWDFPKGHIDPGEDEPAAATRELREEAGISDVQPLPGFKEKIHYQVREHRETLPKEVTYFLGEAASGAVHLSPEHSDHRWATLGEALKLLRFENARELLRKARILLSTLGDAASWPP